MIEKDALFDTERIFYPIIGESCNQLEFIPFELSAEQLLIS